LRTMGPDLIVEPQKGENLSPLFLDNPVLSSAHAILCGIGAGRSHETVDALLKLYERSAVPVVIDADGLFALKGHLDILSDKMCITPHAREYEQLFDKLPEKLEKIKKHVETNAQKYGCTIVLKGKTDIISNGKETWINTTGNEGMTKGGTGDILSGCIAAFATTNPLMESALAATFAVGLAGDTLYAQKKTFFASCDVVKMLPDVLAFCRRY
ncbi:MAG: NAD(P)H-hydrate dehydratase, partial [Candidatus Methanofastidiosia archaeon]